MPPSGSADSELAAECWRSSRCRSSPSDRGGGQTHRPYPQHEAGRAAMGGVPPPFPMTRVAVATQRDLHASTCSAPDCSKSVASLGSSLTHEWQQQSQTAERARTANKACSRALTRTPGTAGTRSYLAARESITCTLHARPRPFAQQGEPTGPRPRGCMKGTPMPPLSSALRAPCRDGRGASADSRSGSAPLPLSRTRRRVGPSVRSN